MDIYLAQVFIMLALIPLVIVGFRGLVRTMERARFARKFGKRRADAIWRSK